MSFSAVSHATASVACDIPFRDRPWLDDDAEDADDDTVVGPVLPAETWGDRFHRAYRIARRRHGPGFTYRAVAARISEYEPTSDVAILRLEARHELPDAPRTRRLALYCLALYGFDPAGFGFEGRMFRPVVWNNARILWDEQERAAGAGWSVARAAP
jgi:hypothetical protein